jgi:hypothetical protein
MSLVVATLIMLGMVAVTVSSAPRRPPYPQLNPPILTVICSPFTYATSAGCQWEMKP